MEPLGPKPERVVHVLEWARIGEFVVAAWCGVGRPPHTRAWLARGLARGDTGHRHHRGFDRAADDGQGARLPPHARLTLATT